MTHDSVNIFFKLLLNNLRQNLYFRSNYSHRNDHLYFFYNEQKINARISINNGHLNKEWAACAPSADPQHRAQVIVLLTVT